MGGISGARILLTGATGFLGRHALPTLLNAGAITHCLARRQSANKAMPPGAQRVIGDCGSGEGLAEAMENKDIIIHMAGLLFGWDWQSYLKANAAACANILKAMDKAKSAAKLLFISSLACAGPCADPRGLDETALPAPVSAYGWSKLLCEKILATGLGKRLVILRPPIIYGSGDRGLLPLFKSAKMGLAVSPGAFRKFPVSIIHADDAARAIVLACGENASGIYHLNDGQVHDMEGFCQAMGKALGRKRIFVAHAPLPLMGLAAACSSFFGQCAGSLAGIFGREAAPPHWNLDKYREARQAGWVANAKRIRNELGFEPRIDLEAGMAEAVSGYRAEGWL